MQHIITDRTMTVVIDGVPKSINRETAGETMWAKARDCITENDVEGIKRILDTSTALQDWAQGFIQVKNGVMYYKDTNLGDNYAAQKALQFMREGLPYQPIIKFIERLLTNPSYRAVQELYKFLEHNNMPLTEDGCFMAYKKVRENFRDIHSNSMDNSPNTFVEVMRNQVDEDSERTCSFGLHVCGYEYLSKFGTGWGDKVVAVVVNPRDVVAVPQDYNNAKMRVCSYYVEKEIHDYETTDPLTRELLWTSYTTSPITGGFAGAMIIDDDIDEEDEFDEDDDHSDCEICTPDAQVEGSITGRANPVPAQVPNNGTQSPLDRIIDTVLRRNP